jgi:phosphate:Na+ symporter
MDGFIQFLTIVGATGLFLYGMKLLSESLQKVMGERIRSILSSMNSNPIRNVFTGIFITGLVQSSSATTVMVVSFVNAGILKLIEAVGLIMGANIGTTLTAWIIAFFGFEFNVIYYTLPIIGLSIPFIFSNNRKLKNLGEFFLGFSLIFLALSLLKEHVPMAYGNWLSNIIEQISSYGYLGYLLFLIVGIIFTIIIRSSSAIFALTVVLAINNWISFELAAIMVLGENIGTTITAITAAKNANVNAKRAALAHVLFNVIGVLWIMLFFPIVLKGIGSFLELIKYGDPFTQTSKIPLALALFHTLFNILNTLVLLGFARQISNFITRRVPTGLYGENEFKLTHIKIGLLSTPEASLYQARREVVVFSEKVRKMFINVEHLFVEKDDKAFQQLKTKIHETEVFADRMENEIAIYLTKVGQGRLSETSSNHLRALYKMIDDIESIADSCMNIVNAIERKRVQKIDFPEHINNNIKLLFNMVRESLDIMVTMLTYDNEVPLSTAQETEKEINNYRDILKNEHLNNLEHGVYMYNAGIIYNDIISQCERIGDFAINVDESFKNFFR